MFPGHIHAGQTAVVPRSCTTPLSTGTRPSESPNQISSQISPTQQTTRPTLVSDQHQTMSGPNHKVLQSINKNPAQVTPHVQGPRPAECKQSITSLQPEHFMSSRVNLQTKSGVVSEPIISSKPTNSSQVNLQTQSGITSKLTISSKPVLSSQVSLFSVSEESFDSELDLSLSTSPAWKPGFLNKTRNNQNMQKQDFTNEANSNHGTQNNQNIPKLDHNSNNKGADQLLNKPGTKIQGQGPPETGSDIPRSTVESIASSSAVQRSTVATPPSVRAMITSTPQMRTPSISGETPHSRDTAFTPQASTSSVTTPVLHNSARNMDTPSSTTTETPQSHNSVKNPAPGLSRHSPPLRAPSLNTPVPVSNRQPPPISTPSAEMPIRTPKPSVQTPGSTIPTPSLTTDPLVRTPSNVRTPSVMTNKSIRTPSDIRTPSVRTDTTLRTPSVETPASSNRSSLSSSRSNRKRKFPGPAGLLPKLVGIMPVLRPGFPVFYFCYKTKN